MLAENLELVAVLATVIPRSYALRGNGFSDALRP